MTFEARIHGLSFIDILDGEAIADPSGGSMKTDSYSIDGAKYADIEYLGRNEITYSFRVMSSPLTGTKADIRRLIEELENAPDDVEFYPYEAEYCTYAKLCHGMLERPKPHHGGTQMLWQARGEVITRDNHFYGAEQGLPYRKNQALPTTWSGTNSGTVENQLDYLMLSGSIANGYQTREIDLTFNGTTTRLVDSLIRGDRFVLDRYGNVRHTFKTEMEQLYNKLQTTVGGPDFLDYGSGGTCAYQSMLLGEDGFMLVPFYGPLPVSSDGCPQLIFYVSQIAGEPHVSYSSEQSLLDLTDTDHIIRLGWNVVDIPNAQGEEFIAFGLTTDDGQVTISYFEAVVDRYFADLPTVEPGEAISIALQDGESSSHILNALHLVYRDGYYF